MGRPSKLTPETTRKICTGVELGLTYKLAANYAGISVGCFMRWMQTGRESKSGRYRDFYDAVKAAEGKGAAVSMARIANAAKTGTWQADAWIMERRHGYTINRGESRANMADAEELDNAESEQVEDRQALVDELRALPADLLREALGLGLDSER